MKGKAISEYLTPRLKNYVSVGNLFSGDLNTIDETGIYRLSPPVTNFPNEIDTSKIIGCVIFHLKWDKSTMYQLFFRRDIQQSWWIYARAKTTFENGWNAWQRIPFTKDLLTMEQVKAELAKNET